MTKPFSNIRFIVAVAAGKGGVGKSSMTANLALALQEMGYAVGVLDADLYGPSLGHIMPLEKPLQKDSTSERKFVPGEFQGVKVFSLSQVRPEEYSMSVRAPVVNGLLLQMTQEIHWGELDYLFVDFPPGTGDIQLTLLQNISFSGAVLITIPSDVSVIDVKKTYKMFEQLAIPIIGVVENMAYFLEGSTSKKHYLFGRGGGQKIAHSFGIPFLGEVPIDPNLCKAIDEGKNFIREQGKSVTALHIGRIVDEVKKNLFKLESWQGSFLRQFELLWEEK